MALSSFRWVGAALVACAAIAAVYLPPDAARRVATPVAAAQIRAQATERRLRSAFVTHQLERRRDELLMAAASRPHDVVMIVGAPVDTNIARMIDQEWAQSGAARGTLRPAVIVENGSTVVIAGVRIPPVTGVTLLPAATGGPFCAAVVRPYVRRWWVTELRRSLGPCAFVARYGPPGPHIAEWLDARQYDIARTTHLGREGSGRLRLLDFNNRALPLPFRLLGVEPEDDIRSLDAIGCMRGDTARCQAAILSARPAPPIGLPPGVAAGSRSQNGFSGAEESYLADLARAIGPERFTKFWTSDAGVEAAFREAAGEPIGTWTRDWAWRRLGRNATSVQLSAASALQGLLAAILLGGAGALLARGRQVR